eukprot:TRINITY_DN484_c3_g1_i1.p1 TRINITY_DN484_c3_g1~~TRINITY_DN484_c3_g1_i1.p1  ORF type:complete len:373 (+),score=143.12 TRINITY_DN484_c3_g1_i1:75-1193(+)
MYSIATKSKVKESTAQLFQPAPIPNYGSSPIQKLRRKLYKLFERPRSSRLATFISIIVLFTVLVSISVFLIESLPEYYGKNNTVLFILDAVTVGIFTVEYLVRLFAAFSTIRFIIYPLNIFDIAVIIEFYVTLITQSNTGVAFLRVLRLFRIFLLFRYEKFGLIFQVLIAALKKSVEAFSLLVTLLVMTLILFAALEYYAEQVWSDFNESAELWIYTWKDNEGQVSPFQSIPHSMWWCIVTMMTVGYGDNFPVTPLGKLVAAICAIIGIIVVAFPVAVLSDSFGKCYQEAHSEDSKAEKQKKLERKRKILSDHLISSFDMQEDIMKTLEEATAVISEIEAKLGDFDLTLTLFTTKGFAGSKQQRHPLRKIKS